ncbi:MAG: hypothetical protein AAB116_23865 [Candidatus Poribacteria bacterium]
MRSDDEIIRYPALRSDLIISRQSHRDKVAYIVKDPVKNQYFKFDENEWAVISMFDGTATLEEIVHRYRANHPGLLIDLQTVNDYKDNMASVNLLEKVRREANVLLIERKKQARGRQLLSMKGSLAYKKIPLVDPDKIFTKAIPYVSFFWSKWFMLLALGCIGIAVSIVVAEYGTFKVAMGDALDLSKLDLIQVLVLWLVIYSMIAVHEIAHGLTCKYYGGEVHEIGVLLIFFQPCVYCNVNDAWLLDKKWKQVIVTIAGSFVELWIGALFMITWATTIPDTFINVLSIRVVVVSVASTILMNFNPLIKLDGYYLLVDYLGMPNLRENAFKYLKHISVKRLMGQAEDEFEVSNKEKRVFTLYGVLATAWIVSVMLGMFAMTKKMLADRFGELGIIISLAIGYRLFFPYLKRIFIFMLRWFRFKKTKVLIPLFLLIALAIVFVPLPSSVRGRCSLEPVFVHVIRANSSGILREFILHDGQEVIPGTVIARIENTIAKGDRRVAAVGVKYEGRGARPALLSCDDELKKLDSYVKYGDELCRAIGISPLKGVMRLSQFEVKSLKENARVELRLNAMPFKKITGRVSKITSAGQSGIYEADILFENNGEMRPGMDGVAKVITRPSSIFTKSVAALARFFRIDLFF